MALELINFLELMLLFDEVEEGEDDSCVAVKVIAVDSELLNSTGNCHWSLFNNDWHIG